MADSPAVPRWQDRLLPILHLFAEGGLVLALRNLFEALELVEQLRDRIGYHGMYEILDYNSSLVIKDPEGKDARLIRHEHIKLLQDNVVAIHDHAWGDGELFAEYRCQPGVPVDFYQDGSKWNVLISPRETQNRGDELDFRVERELKDGLTQSSEWLETEVDHLVQTALGPNAVRLGGLSAGTPTLPWPCCLSCAEWLPAGLIAWRRSS